MTAQDSSNSYVKAIAVVPTMEYVMYKFGKEKYRDVIDALPEHLKDRFRKRMDKSEWIPLEDFVEFNRAIIKVLYRGNIDGAIDLGAESAEQGMTTVHKFAFKLGSVGMLLPKATDIFSTYYKPASLEIVESKKGYAKLVMRNMKDNTGVIARRVRGFLHRTLELMGSKNIEFRVGVDPNNPKDYLYIASWD